MGQFALYAEPPGHGLEGPCPGMGRLEKDIINAASAGLILNLLRLNNRGERNVLKKKERWGYHFFF